MFKNLNDKQKTIFSYIFGFLIVIVFFGLMFLDMKRFEVEDLSDWICVESLENKEVYCKSIIDNLTVISIEDKYVKVGGGHIYKHLYYYKFNKNLSVFKELKKATYPTDKINVDYINQELKIGDNVELKITAYVYKYNNGGTIFDREDYEILSLNGKDIKDLEPVVKAPEVEAPEAEIKEVVVKQEYWKQASPLPVSYPVAEETEVVEQDVVAKAPEVIEVESTVIKEEAPVTESNEVIQNTVDSTGIYDAGSDNVNFSSYPVSCSDFASNANLIALQTIVNPQISEDGGCNNGFVLKNGKAIISYVGESYFVDCMVGVNASTNQTILSINCNPNDLSWSILNSVMNEVYPNIGSSLLAEVKNACYNGSNIYSTPDTWVESNGLHTKFVVEKGGDTLSFIFK